MAADGVLPPCIFPIWAAMPLFEKLSLMLQKQNFIRRLAQGVYDYPKMHDLLGHNSS